MKIEKEIKGEIVEVQTTAECSINKKGEIEWIYY